MINLNLLDRYLLLLEENSIEAIPVFSKIDLLTSETRGKFDATIAQLRLPYLLISNVTENGMSELNQRLLPCKTYCLLGPSGAGKTSLLNSLCAEDKFKVNYVRKRDGKGRHTTMRRQLTTLENRSIFIDTPGMRELGNFALNFALDKTFTDFSVYASQCRFRNCTHTHEKGCAVIAAMKSGDISRQQYLNYLKLHQESEFYDIQYQQKRQKAKNFGKMKKNYKKKHNPIDHSTHENPALPPQLLYNCGSFNSNIKIHNHSQDGINSP